MINQQFSENLSRLTDKLNKVSFGKDSRSFPVSRLRNSLSFILEKQNHFSENLDDLMLELEEMKKDAEKLFSEFSTRPESFQILEYIKTLVQVVVNEKISRKAAASQKNYSVLRKEKVKIFHSSFASEAEKNINKFLEENNIEITRVIQSSKEQGAMITIFYKEI